MTRLNTSARSRGRSTTRYVSAVAALILAGASLGACANEPPASDSDDVTTSSSPKLEQFDPDAVKASNTGLPKRLAYANQASAPFLLAMGANMKAAAQSRGIDFVTSVAEGDPAKYVDQMNQFITRGVGAMVTAPIDPVAQRPSTLKAIDEGIGILSLVATPSTMVGQTDQYAVGKASGTSAAKWIADKMGGKANVLYMNIDSQGAEAKKRHKGVLDALKEGGDGVKVVVDVEPKSPSSDGGFQVATTALQAHPEINVVLGGDTFVTGAFRAFDDAKKLTDDMYFGGVDGDPEALKLIEQGTQYRTSHGFAWQVLGQAYGQHAADWIEGKSIPRALVVAPVELTRETIPAYDADMNAAADVYADKARYAKYVEELGTVSFKNKDLYWSKDFSPS